MKAFCYTQLFFAVPSNLEEPAFDTRRDETVYDGLNPKPSLCEVTRLSNMFIWLMQLHFVLSRSVFVFQAEAVPHRL